MPIEKLQIISDFIIYCLCPLLVILDFSYSTLDFDAVFKLCEKWWRTLKAIPVQKIIALLPEKVTEIFRAMYGKKHISIHCLSRSCISSILAMSIVFFLLNAFDLSGLGDNNAFEQLSRAYNVLGEKLGISPFFVFFTSLVLNLCIDYISLLETRWILSRIGKANVTRTCFLTLIDYLFTTSFWVITFYISIRIINFLIGNEAIPFFRIDSALDIVFFPFAFASQIATTGSIANESGVPIGHIIALLSVSTYFTSIIFYIFSIATIFLRISDRLIDRLSNLLLNYSQKKVPRPLTLLGIILAAISKAAVVIVKGIAYLNKT